MSTEATGHDPLIGQVLGHYRVMEEIGSGGMGVVYRAHDEHLDREVAIKVLPFGTLADDTARRRFRNEALALSKVNHPNIATIFDFDTQQGLDFLVMEYIAGITLSDKLAQGSLAERQVITLGTQLAEGLAAAHEHAVIHRDLKPGNLRVAAEGRLKILDFGLAKLRAAGPASAVSETLSETHTMAGTLPYMAPEQVLGGGIDARTDIHAAGAVLYEMATGERAFPQAERTQLTSAILQRTPQPAIARNPKLSGELSRIIGKCLEKEPGERYQAARELAVDLRRLAREKDLEHRKKSSLDAGIWVGLGRWKALIAAGAGVAVVLLVALFVVGRIRRASEATHIESSIAVLPFVDLSAAKDQEYFSDGLAEELLNSLAKVPGLRVAGRTSSFQFRGKNEDLRVIGQKLNVATILEGSVRKQGQRVRITTQLIQTSDGFHLWSETYDRDLTDIFAVQEEIARSVAGALRVTLLGEKPPAPRPTSVEAYNAYLQGQYFLARPGREGAEKAMTYYEQAIKLDANYAPAWAGLSLVHSFRAEAFFGPVQEEIAKAREAAERALVLDPGLAAAYSAMAKIKRDYDYDWDAADVYYQRALVLEPANADALAGAAHLAMIRNNFDEALRLDRRASELDPLNAVPYHNVGFIAWWAGRLDESEAAVKKAYELNPDSPWLPTVLCRVYLARSRPREALLEAERETIPAYRLQCVALAYHALGRKQDSDRALAELIATHQGNGAFVIAEVYGFRGEVDSAFDWLERAYQQREEPLTEMKGDPLLENLQHDPRYPAFLKKMRLL